jgi:hypothetical protein
MLEVVFILAALCQIGNAAVQSATSRLTLHQRVIAK